MCWYKAAQLRARWCCFFLWWLMSYCSLCLLNIKKLLIINSFLLFGCVSHVATLAAHEYGAPYFHQVCCDFVVLLSCRGYREDCGWHTGIHILTLTPMHRGEEELRAIGRSRATRFPGERKSDVGVCIWCSLFPAHTQQSAYCHPSNIPLFLLYTHT